MEKKMKKQNKTNKKQKQKQKHKKKKTPFSGIWKIMRSDEDNQRTFLFLFCGRGPHCIWANIYRCHLPFPLQINHTHFS